MREHALAEGDDAMISAMLHNVATLGADHILIADAFGKPLPHEAQRALMEAGSTKNHDFGIGTLALSSFVPLVLAQLMTADGRYADAIAIYSDVVDHNKPDNPRPREACFLADRAWCHLRLGDTRAASSDAVPAEAAVFECCDADDLATARARLFGVKTALGDEASAGVHNNLATLCLENHRTAQTDLLDQLLANLPKQPRDGKLS